MESNRLHPLLIAAAVSLTVFSAVGVAALTGLLPQTRGSSDELEAPKAVAARPVEPAVVPPQVVAPIAPVAADAPPAAPAVQKKIVHHAPRKAVNVAEAPQPALLPPPPMAQTPATVPPAPLPAQLAGIGGVVESVREVTQPGQAKGAGAITGGLVGGLLGSQLGHGGGRKVLTVLGAAGGALAGHTIEKDATATKHWEVSVRLDDGTTKTLTSDAVPFWHTGDRVRYLDGRLQPA